MRRGGAVSGVLLSKLALVVALAVLFGSVLTFYGRIDRVTRREKLQDVLDAVTDTLRTAVLLPGRVKFKSSLPTVEGYYEILLSQEIDQRHLVKVSIRGEKGLKKYLSLSRSLHPKKFRMIDPQRIIVVKSKKVSVEVT